MTEDLLGFQSLDQFTGYLKGFIDINGWGTGGAKSPAELYKELLEGDSGLVREENGLLRLTWPLFIDVSYQDSDLGYRCYESKSKKGVFRNLPGTFAEKRHANESIDDAIRRTHDEEIKDSLPLSGLSLRNSELNFQNEWEENTSARSYPGLQTRSINTMFVLQIAPDQGIPKPFVLVEKNGTSEFDWKIER